MPKLQAFLKGPTLLVKRDDLTPFGGGKYRKVSVLIEDACRRRATVLLTQGSIESRHARTTAILAREKGLPCVLVLSPERDPDSQEPTLLDCNEGARIILTENGEARSGAGKSVRRVDASGSLRSSFLQRFGAATALAYLRISEIKEQVSSG